MYGNDLFSDLESEVELNTAVYNSKNTEKFLCSKCDGIGIYQGVRTYQEKSKCFACNGRGFFVTSPEQRAKSKALRAKVKAKKEAEKELLKSIAFDVWKKENLELFTYLDSVKSWNDFANSLLDSAFKFGSLTKNQTKACNSMKAKHEEKQKQKAKEIENKKAIDLTPIKTLFNNAIESGLKNPKIRINNLTLSLAKQSSRNPGCIYVKDLGEYAGKVTPSGEYFGLREARKEIENELKKLSEMPVEALTAYGKRTGNCACCGKELTNKQSIELGIGPICAGKWGLK